MKYLEIHGLYRDAFCDVCREVLQCKQITFVKSYVNEQAQFEEIEICADCMHNCVALAKMVREIVK